MLIKGVILESEVQKKGSKKEGKKKRENMEVQGYKVQKKEKMEGGPYVNDFHPIHKHIFFF